MGVSKLATLLHGASKYLKFLHNHAEISLATPPNISLPDNIIPFLFSSRMQNSFSIKGCNVLKSNKSAEISGFF
jgi:hypothetical protein